MSATLTMTDSEQSMLMLALEIVGKQFGKDARECREQGWSPRLVEQFERQKAEAEALALKIADA